jgi:beta-lactamase class A
MGRSVIAVVAGIVCFTIGIGVGWFVFTDNDLPKLKTKEASEVKETRNQQGFRFVSPLLECDNSISVLRPSMGHLEAELKVFIAEAIRNGYVSEVSVYYRDLNNGPWMGIDQDKPFSPASLLKVPIMIAALKKAESDRSLLKKSFVFDATVPQDFVNPNIVDDVIKFGHNYTYEDLIFRMMVNSDNNAKNLLAGILGDDAIIQVWTDLGLTAPGPQSPEDFLTVREYSSFFRILYNATYLSKELSEKALEIMSKSHFDKALQAGIPQNVVLSNKFGERGLIDSDIKQLHDCGVIYATPTPYLLCVMTRGKDWDVQAGIIAEVSKKVYAKHVATN